VALSYYLRGKLSTALELWGIPGIIEEFLSLAGRRQGKVRMLCVS
jgi:hypothetical protein